MSIQHPRRGIWPEGAARRGVLGLCWGMERLFGCDPAKRTLLLATRHFDLLDMAEVFADAARLDLPDDRRDYGETRRITVGYVLGRAFTVVYTLRGPTTWLVTAWPADRKERARHGESR